MKRMIVSGACLLGCVAAASHATAQTPKGLLNQSSASSGSTEVAQGGFQATEKQGDAKEVSELKLSAGGMLTSGNSRSMALTGSGHLRLRRLENQYSADLAGNYGRAAAGPDEAMQTSVENLQGRIRYDRFLTDHWSVFVAQTARKDRFQGLDLRLSFDPGVAYYVFDVEKHRLWAELGYDFQYDIRDSAALSAAMEPLSKTEARHSARAFAGYENNLNEALRFTTGLEYLQAVKHSENWRLSWDVGLSSSISTAFSLATTFSVRYDNNPLPGVENTDTVTALNLVYTLL
jgi:putative salt-induced outer membrane protein YdiY